MNSIAAQSYFGGPKSTKVYTAEDTIKNEPAYSQIQQDKDNIS